MAQTTGPTDRLLDFMNHFIGALDRVARLLGPAMITLGVVIITANIVVFFRSILPAWAQPLTLQWAVLGATGISLLGLILQPYILCITANPGYTTGLTPKQLRELDPAQADVAPQASDQERWCRSCEASKPPRVHHCSVCDRCILRLDHHCPWLNNCVAFNTYPYFVRLLLWIVLGCCFQMALGGHLFMAFLQNGCTRSAIEATAVTDADAGWLLRTHSWLSSWWLVRQDGCSRLFNITMAVDFSVAVGVSALLAFHLYLSATQQSSIEFAGNYADAQDDEQTAAAAWARGVGRRQSKGCGAKLLSWFTCCKVPCANGRIRHRYDHGRRKNWQLTFGTDSWWRWAFPPSLVGVQRYPTTIEAALAASATTPGNSVASGQQEAVGVASSVAPTGTATARNAPASEAASA